MEKNYLVEKTYGNGSKLIHIDSFKEVISDLADKTVTRRYFKIPDLDSLQEIRLEVIEAPIKYSLQGTPLTT